MQIKKLYCANCRQHTDHVDLPDQYASACKTCGTHTSSLMRTQAREVANLNAPDGTPAEIVENNPDSVTFYVPTGPHQGYYYHDKRTGANEIKANNK